jgi:LAO/AO transport system kinase
MTEVSRRLLAGDRRVLSRVLSQLESGDPSASEILEEVDRHTGAAYTIGITGPPGAGKSTIVDQLTGVLRREGKTVGVLGVDPTSPYTGGALLGDRIRMQRHYLDPGVFIRSVATRGQSGGLPRIVKGMARLLDAANNDVVLVETVGVGQTELGIMGVADTVLVTMNPESGDAIQALKAGIMEIADIYVVNKADREGANQMAAAITAMLRIGPTHPTWLPPVVLTQAQSGEGIPELWNKVQEHRDYINGSGELDRKRTERRKAEFVETVHEELGRRLRALLEADPELIATLEQVANGAAEPYSSALEFLDSSKGPVHWITHQAPREG